MEASQWQASRSRRHTLRALVSHFCQVQEQLFSCTTFSCWFRYGQLTSRDMQQCKLPRHWLTSALPTFRSRTRHDVMDVNWCNHEKSQFLLYIVITIVSQHILVYVELSLCTRPCKFSAVNVLHYREFASSWSHHGMQQRYANCTDEPELVWSIWHISVWLYVSFCYFENSSSHAIYIRWLELQLLRFAVKQSFSADHWPRAGRLAEQAEESFSELDSWKPDQMGQTWWWSLRWRDLDWLHIGGTHRAQSRQVWQQQGTNSCKLQSSFV